MFEGHKHLLGLKQLTAQQIQTILKTADGMKDAIVSGNKKLPDLQGKSVVTVFYENSTRTRLSFELAAKYMGATAANISSSGSSVAKGETLLDTARTIDQMLPDVMILRHQNSGAPELISKHVKACVINAGDGMHEHPTQGLLDLFTIWQKKGDMAGLKVAIVGDIAHSRVARSNIYGLTKLGATVALGAPGTLLPRGLAHPHVTVHTNVEDAVRDADVIMGLRIQKERQTSGLLPSVGEYAGFFGIDSARLGLAKPGALLLHPGPVNRGVELTSGVIDGEASLIDEQVLNGVAVRMAVLKLFTQKEGA